MIVLVAGHDVEEGAAGELFAIRGGEVQLSRNKQSLLVGVGEGFVQVEVGHRAEGLHVELLSVGEAVKALGHEVLAAVLFHETTVRHRDLGRACHEVVGILDTAIALRVG